MGNNDKVTIGLTVDNRKVMEDLFDKGWFGEWIDIAKLAISVAINNGVKPGKTDGAETVWNVGSFDSGGELRNLVSALFPDVETPYRAIEHFLNAGMQILNNRMRERGGLTVVDLMEIAKAPGLQSDIVE